MISRLHAFAAAFAACTLLLSAGASSAADGEILINQAKVNAGGITAGDAAGFPASLTRSGRYKLSSNLVVPSGQYAIDVTANDVTIDLNGFTISGAAADSAGGVMIRDGDRVRVMNGTITGLNDFGIYLAGGSFSVVENMRIINSSGFGHAALYAGRQSRIRNNTLVNNIFNIVDCARCLIEQNIIVGSNFYGVSAEGGQVVDNVIAGNNSFGLTSSGTNFPNVGYGNNILVGNNGGNAQVHDNVVQLHPNVCVPACP